MEVRVTGIIKIWSPFNSRGDRLGGPLVETQTETAVSHILVGFLHFLFVFTSSEVAKWDSGGHDSSPCQSVGVLCLYGCCETEYLSPLITNAPPLCWSAWCSYTTNPKFRVTVFPNFCSACFQSFVSYKEPTLFLCSYEHFYCLLFIISTNKCTQIYYNTNLYYTCWHMIRCFCSIFRELWYCVC